MNSNQPQLKLLDNSQYRAADFTSEQAASVQYVNSILSSNVGNVRFTDSTMDLLRAHDTLPFFEKNYGGYINGTAGKIVASAYDIAKSFGGKDAGFKTSDVRGAIRGEAITLDLEHFVSSYVIDNSILDISDAPDYKGMGVVGKVASVGAAVTILAAGCGKPSTSSHTPAAKNPTVQVQHTQPVYVPQLSSEPADVATNFPTLYDSFGNLEGRFDEQGNFFTRDGEAQAGLTSVPVTREYFSNVLHDNVSMLYLQNGEDGELHLFGGNGLNYGLATEHMSNEAIISAQLDYANALSEKVQMDVVGVATDQLVQDRSYVTPHFDSVGNFYNPDGSINADLSAIPVGRQYFSNTLHEDNEQLFLRAVEGDESKLFDVQGKLIGNASDYMNLNALAEIMDAYAASMTSGDGNAPDTARIVSGYNPVNGIEDVIAAVGSFDSVGRFITEDGKTISNVAIPLKAGVHYAAAEGRPDTVYLVNNTTDSDDQEISALYTINGDPIVRAEEWVKIEDEDLIDKIRSGYIALLDANGLKVDGEAGTIVAKDGGADEKSSPWLDMSKPGIDDVHGNWDGITLDKYGNHVNEKDFIVPGGNDVAIPVVPMLLRAGTELPEGTSVYLTERAPGHWDARDQNGGWLGPASKFVSVDSISDIQKYNEENLQPSNYQKLRQALLNDLGGQRRTLGDSVIGGNRFNDGMSWKEKAMAGFSGNERAVTLDGRVHDLHQHNYAERVLRGSLGSTGSEITEHVGQPIDRAVDGLGNIIFKDLGQEFISDRVIGGTVGHNGLKVPLISQLNQYGLRGLFGAANWVVDKTGDAIEQTPTVVLNAPADVSKVLDVVTADRLHKVVEEGHPKGTPLVNVTRFNDDEAAKNTGVHALETTSGLLKLLGLKHMVSPTDTTKATSGANTVLGGSGNLGGGIKN